VEAGQAWQKLLPAGQRRDKTYIAIKIPLDKGCGLAYLTFIAIMIIAESKETPDVGRC
jgi:hypothetical protein